MALLKNQVLCNGFHWVGDSSGYWGFLNGGYVSADWSNKDVFGFFMDSIRTGTNAGLAAVSVSSLTDIIGLLAVMAHVG